MTQQEFNGDFTKMHVMLRFRVTDTVGQDALTTFVGHHHQTNHIRRQIRRYRGKIDDVMDAVTEDGYLVRIKPLIITQKRVQTSVKQAIRSKTREVVRGFVAKSTYDGLQVAMLDGSLENNIQNSIKSIYPCKSVVIRKSQLLQAGVTMDAGPTLDEIHSQEARSAAELKAKKAAALAEAMEEESEDSSEDAEETTEEVTEAPAEVAEAPEPVAEEAPAAEEVVEEAPAEASTDYSSMTVAQLKELLKEAGKPVSGKKAELIERLQE
jgi:small subunit ribosomal protein S3Ae